MSYALFKTVNFGPGRAGLSTVGYTLTLGPRITAGVAEIGTGTGIYGATVTFTDSFAGSILWDTGQGASTVYAVEEVNPEPPAPSPTPTPTPTSTTPIEDANAADQALVQAVTNPRRVSSDAGAVESHSIPDLIMVSKYLASVAATRLKRRGLRFNHMVAPGMVGRRAGELGGGYGNDDSWGIVGGYPE